MDIINQYSYQIEGALFFGACVVIWLFFIAPDGFINLLEKGDEDA